MQRHLSTGSTLLSALMAAQRCDPAQEDRRDVIQLLASLGRAAPARGAAEAGAARRDETVPPAT